MATKKKSAKSKAKKSAPKGGKKASKGKPAKKAAAKPARKAKAKPARKAKAKPARKAKAKLRPIPANYPRVSVGLNLPDARAAIDFCKQVLGAKVRLEMPDPNGKLIHAELQVGDSIIMVGDAVRDPVQTGALMVYVPNADKAIAAAVQAGASIVTPAQDMFWGDRVGRVRDPQGNYWSLATHVEDVSPREMKKRAAAFAAQVASATAPVAAVSLEAGPAVEATVSA